MPAKSKEKTKEASVKVDALEDALKVQESLDGAQDGAPLSVEERDDIQTEISDELAALAGTSEPAAIPDSDSAMPESTTVSCQNSEAKTMAKEIGGMVAGGAAMVFGRDYGVNDTAIDKWAESMAPLLVKYGVTDMNVLMEKWGPEIQASVGCFALGMGIMVTKRRYKLEDAVAAAAKAKKEEGAKAHGNQSQ